MTKIKIGCCGLALLLGGLTCVVNADQKPLPDVLTQSSVPATNPEQGFLLSITSAGDRLVAVGDSGRVILSDDHGNSWRQAVVPVNVLLTQVRFASVNEGWAIGHLGVVLHSKDGGETWQRQLDGALAAQLVLAQAQVEAALEGGDVEQADRAVRQAQYLLEDGPDKPFLTMQVEDAQRVTVFGAFGLALRTTDGGKSWSPLNTGYFNPGSLHYYGSANDHEKALVVGEQGLLLRGQGDSFESVEQPYAGTLFGVVATGNVSVAYGLRGNAVRSLDDGKHWQVVDTGVSASLQGGLALRDGRILLLAENGQVALSDRYAERFHVLEKTIRPAIEAVQVGDDQLVLVGPMGVQALSLAVGESVQ
ncbi:YCF48-related protein [Pseudomonas sp. BN515]|uniref:WD40/YVTN/BNR-like repeat-containing protein n=1 Tax=Pseudomonas sp. BN515 TaxID=2567892 RepID=UPI002458064A|nr:YCF48-related protein [Pseudomonas sp. BN515]MDH4874454.1 hypothetical protein [Pseudomonas sp. BN515]